MNLLNFILHLDTSLDALISQFGIGIYVILFIVMFCETGLVVTPFLPGDSLLFAAGAFAARGTMSFWILFITLTIAAILGDTVNYWIGHKLGAKVFTRETGFFNKEHLTKTHAFYEKYGPKAIVLGRFIPIIRTFAPFVAGVGKMAYPTFVFYNITGAILWVGLALGAGYLFGNIPVVKDNFTLVILAIIGISLLPVIWEAYSHRKKKIS